jgi:hypothetical protein
MDAPRAGRPAGPAAGAAGNGPPRIEALRLVPGAPRPGDRVVAEVDWSDPEGDRVELSYQWLVDGRRLPGERGDSLHVEGLPKGRRIEVEVVARDAGGASEAARLGTRVANQRPILHDVILEPLGEVSVLNDVVARARATDPDGDPIRLRYAWRVNGERVEGDGEGEVLRATSFARGDRIELRVVASDGEDESEPLRSAPIEVANASPRFRSKPGRLDEDGVFRYRLEVEDPDGDRLFRYRLEKGPRGLRLDPVEGRITWTPEPDQAGDHEVVVQVDDRKGGTSTQSFGVAVEFEPAAPPAAPAAEGPARPAPAANPGPAAQAEPGSQPEPESPPEPEPEPAAD